MMIIKTTGMKWLKQLFHINEHRINNTGWMTKWRWNGGVERKAKLLLRETLSIRLECEEVSLQIEFTTLPPKNHNLFVKNWNEKGTGEKGIAATG
jgi:hypothetical protein